MLTISLFGEFQCLQHGQPLSALYAPRLRALLAYLLLHRATPVARQQLAYHFWPESGDAQARTNLRNLLNQLRHALPNLDLYIATDLQSFHWRATAPATVDVIEFQQALQQAQQAQDRTLRRHMLEQAISHYQADLLPGSYDDWVASVRESLRHDYLHALEALADLLEQERDYRAALATTQRLLAADNLREGTYARLMNLHAATGDRATALRVYHTCATTMMRELGVEPAPTTRAIYERLLNIESEETTVSVLPTTTTLVGRANAWSQLQSAWQQAQRGRPHLLLIMGEAGIGKTRLAEELVEWANRQGIATATAHCYRAAGGLALTPILDWLRTPLFRPALAALDPVRRADLARLMPEVAHEATAHLPTAFSSDAWQRQRLFEVLAHLLLWKEQPLLLFIDDLQWCDAETTDWLHYLLRMHGRARFLLMGTVRSEEFGPSHALHQLLLQLRRTDELVEIELERLDANTTAHLVTNLTGQQLDEDASTEFYTQTEGNPLFIVETIRAQLRAQSAGKAPLLFSPTRAAPQALPPKVHAVIESRLARLSPSARSLVDVAAVIGRSFTIQGLTLTSEQHEDTLTLGLDELWQNKIVRTQDADAYNFSHDKLREVAYGALSPAWRRLLHQRVARALEVIYNDNLDQISGQLAYHYEQASQVKEAIAYYGRAAAIEQRRFALTQAIDYLQRGLGLLPRLVNENERQRTELMLQVSLGPMLLAKRGYGAPEVEQTLRRAYELCQQFGESAQLFRVLGGLGRFYIVLPNLTASLAVGQQMLAMAQAQQKPDLLIEAHNSLGASHFQRGELAAARQQLAAAIDLFTELLPADHALRYGQDPRVVAYTRQAWALWLLGEADAALAHSQLALALVRDEVTDPFSRALTFAHSALLFQMMADQVTALHYAQLASNLARQQGFPFFLGMAEQIWGWALVKQGETESGLQKLLTGQVIFRSSGAELGIPYFATLHAEAYAQLGQIDQGLAILAEGLGVVAKTAERWNEPELHRLQGDLLRRRGSSDTEIQACLTKAQAVAHALGARGWLARIEQARPDDQMTR